jgi:SHS2 domain-containing protein
MAELEGHEPPVYSGAEYHESMPARGFEVLEHPADIGLRAFGGTLPELFACAAVAMLSIAADPEAVEPRQEYELRVESADRESLLVDWLNEVLYWFDGKGVAFRDFRFTEWDEVSLRATGRGEPRERGRHRARLIVKGVTYHQLKIERRDGLWVAEVYLDI